MLPLSGLREAVSKSNSLSLVPSTTTTRVSSGWLASISMRRAMGALLETLGTDTPARATGGPCRLSGARGTERFDPPNGHPVTRTGRTKTGKHRAAEPLPVLPTSRFLMSRPQGADPGKGAAGDGRLL